MAPVYVYLKNLVHHLVSLFIFSFHITVVESSESEASDDEAISPNRKDISSKFIKKDEVRHSNSYDFICYMAVFWLCDRHIHFTFSYQLAYTYLLMVDVLLLCLWFFCGIKLLGDRTCNDMNFIS